MEAETRVPIKDKLNLTVDEAAEYSNIGEKKIRELMADPRCPFILIVGKKRLIKRKQFEAWLAKQCEID